jgi:uncharacterized protein DUF4238
MGTAAVTLLDAGAAGFLYGSPMNEPRRHHYVPRMLLKGFADDDEKVWVRREGTGRWHLQHIDRVAFERDFYADEQGSIATETWFRTGVETPAVAALATARLAHFTSLEAGRFPGVLQLFAAAQLARTRGFREHWRGFKSEQLTDFANGEFEKASVVARGVKLTADEETELREALNDAVATMLSRDGDLDTMKHAIDVATRALIAKPCIRMVAPIGTEFECSDEPAKVIRIENDGTVNVLAFQGVGRSDTALWLPISHAAGLWFGSDPRLEPFQAVHLLNNVVAYEASLRVRRWKPSD